ncbi:MAG: tRNA pseudouridine(13) synthase TruD [Methanomassiliicoccaceae archaeon]|jgi:tRNA pseudouridine13 synthase|nr:tRNA pseudouridine(13) synthase TruD [Methanomassiliicoccaceae archaeon]
MTMYRRCDTAEADIGMRYYLTDTDGTGGRLKREPEDFIVKEISKHPDEKGDGRFIIAEVTSRNWETNRLIRIMSRSMNISRERIGFAGTKDKRAVTTQLMSFEAPDEALSKVDLKDVTVRNAYRSRRGVQIGDLIGNRFEITVKDCLLSKDDTAYVIGSVTSSIKASKGFPNYFGVQRFGAVRPVTHIVGEKIVRGDIKGAVDTYLSHPSEHEQQDTKDARELLADRSSFADALKVMPKTMSFEKTMAEHLMKHPDDDIGAISKLPTNLQMMFTHAYQSYLFNLMLSRRMEHGIPLDRPAVGDVVIPADADRIPMHERPATVTEKNIRLVEKQIRSGKAFITISLIGTESTIADGPMGDIERSIIYEEKMTNDSFLVPGLPHCSSKGSRREILCPLTDIESSVTDGGYTLRFSLPKGNYATCLLREYMKSDMISY